nr:uncharacterized protein LOC116426913 [Nomia melanderi]
MKSILALHVVEILLLPVLAPIGDTEILFSQFRSVYPYEYLLKRSTYECDGYLLLGSSDAEILGLIEKISPLIWKTKEILVIVNNQTSDDSGVLNRSLYGIANVNVVSMSGMWKLSENYLNPREFRKLDRYEEMIHNYDKIDFRGRMLRICSIHRPPMTFWNHTIKTSVNNQEADVYVVDDNWDGVEMLLFLNIAEKLNFTWTVMKPEGNYTYGHKINDTFWEGGMIGMLSTNKADMAFGSIWMTHTQFRFTNFSVPWYQMFVHILVPRPRRATSFWAIVKPFSAEVWYLLAFTLILFSLYTCVRAWIDPKFPKRHRNYIITLTDLIGCFLSSFVPKTLAHNKLEILLWQTTGWLIITAYCSSLAARLATLEYESRIDTVEQFVRMNLSWGNMGQAPPFNDYVDPTDPFSLQLPSRYRHVESFAEWRKLTMRGNFGVLGKMIGRYFYPEEYVPDDSLKNYRVMKNFIGYFHTAFAVQPWLLAATDKVLLSLRENGIVDRHLNHVSHKHDSRNLREVLVEHDRYDGTVQVLGLTPLAAGFFFLLFGSLAAAVVFYLELRCAARATSIRHILRTINDKRKTTGKSGEKFFTVSEHGTERSLS